MRGTRAKLKAGFRYNAQKQPVPESGSASLVKKPLFDTKPDSHQGGRKSVGFAAKSLANSMKKETCGGCHC